MKKTVLSVFISAGLLVGASAHAQEFATFGTGLAGGATFFPSTGSFSYSYSNPYGNITGQAQAQQPTIQAKAQARSSGAKPTTQNNIGGTVLVVNADGPVNLKAYLQNKGNIVVNQP